MWSNGKDTNELGESVLLLQPVNGKRRGKRTSCASFSHVGGLPAYHDDEHQSIIDNALKYSNPKCTRCCTQMYLLLQLHAPLDDLDRTLYVFGCNNPSCHILEESTSSSMNGVGDETVKTRFCANFGGTLGGAVRCFRSQKQQLSNNPITADEKTSEAKLVETPQTLADNDWGMDDDSGGWGDTDDGDDWGEVVGGTEKASDNTISMNDLETMLTNCEMQSNQAAASKSSVPHATSSKQHAKEKQSDISVPSFAHHDLEMIDEPVRKTQIDSSDDENDDDDLVANVDASKVDSMLSRYMDMEDDEEIINALKGGTNITNNICGGGNGGGGEKYERLKPEEKAFMLFSKRLRRAPEQVCRYAYQGESLWSIPLPPTKKSNGKIKKKQTKPKKNKKSITAEFPSIPRCSCGSERVFEFQLLPCLLHVLDVDSENSNSDDGNDITDLTSMGGMNWGSIAVYSCPESCDESREEFLIVQESGEDVATKQKTEPMSEEDNDNDE